MAKNLKSIDLKKDFEHINSNTEYLKSNSGKAKKSALEVLAIAKEQEKEKLSNGSHYVSVNDKTMILTKPKN